MLIWTIIKSYWLTQKNDKINKSNFVQDISNQYVNKLVMDYSLFDFNKKKHIGHFESDQYMEKGNIISIDGKQFIITELGIPQQPLRLIEVHPALIKISEAINNKELMEWFRYNIFHKLVKLSGLDKPFLVRNYYLDINVKLYNEQNSCEYIEYPRFLIPQTSGNVTIGETLSETKIDILEHDTIEFQIINELSNNINL